MHACLGVFAPQAIALEQRLATAPDRLPPVAPAPPATGPHLQLPEEAHRYFNEHDGDAGCGVEEGNVVNMHPYTMLSCKRSFAHTACKHCVHVHKLPACQLSRASTRKHTTRMHTHPGWTLLVNLKDTPQGLKIDPGASETDAHTFAHVAAYTEPPCCHLCAAPALRCFHPPAQLPAAHSRMLLCPCLPSFIVELIVGAAASCACLLPGPCFHQLCKHAASYTHFCPPSELILGAAARGYDKSDPSKVRGYQPLRARGC